MQLTDEEFINLMQEYDLLKFNSSAENEDKACIGSKTKPTKELLIKYGFNDFELEDVENISESEVLQFIEYETGRNTFPYSKESCMNASARAAVKYSQRGKYEPVARSLTEAYTHCISEEEQKWHANTGTDMSSLKTELNRYTDLNNIFNNERLRKGQKIQEILTEVNQYFDNQYLRLLSVAVALNNNKLREINNDFANYKRLEPIEFQYSNSERKANKTNENNYHEEDDIPKTGKGAAYRSGTFYGYDYSGMSNYSTSYEDEIAKAMEAGNRCRNSSDKKIATISL